MDAKNGIRSGLIAKAHDEILQIFESIAEKEIVLIVDKILAPLVHVALDFQMNKIKKFGVINTYYLDDEKIAYEKNVVYFVSNKNRKLDSIILQMLKCPNYRYYIYFSPKCSVYLNEIFERIGLAGKYVKGKLSECGLLPVDSDILSMEIPIKINLIDIKDYTCNVVHVLNNISFSNVYCVGKMSKSVGLLLEKKSQNKYVMFDDMIIIDRQCDLITPLLSQKTYRGLISEYLQMTYSELVHEHLRKIHDNPEKNKTQSGMKISNKLDNVYNETKDMYFHDAVAHLTSIIKKLEQTRNKNEKPSMQELSVIVNCLKKYPKDVVEFNVDNCVKIATLFKQNNALHVIEDEICEHKNHDNNKLLINDVRDIQMLRLLCLMSHCSNDDLRYTNFKYECRKFCMYERLQDVNLLKQKTCPTMILPKIITKILQKKDIPKEFETFYPNNPIGNQNNKIFIFIIGGITYDEICDVKKLQLLFPTKKFYIGTTNIINKITFVSSFED